MGKVSTYLNFKNETEEAFTFYRSVFGGEFGGEIMRLGEAPGSENMSEEDKKLVMHIELPILGGHILMGTDAPESMGFTLNFGNNMHIQLETDTRNEADNLYRKLSAGGIIDMELQETFWGGYYGSFADKYGVKWMIHCSQK
jgi:PhnB protein